jgi:tetratricopeptide (TPR) repeat protein
MSATAGVAGPQAHVASGRRHVLAGRFAEAAQCFAAALRIEPNDAHVWHDFGTALRKSGRDEAAFDAFRNALSIDPTRAESYLNLGNLLIDAGQLDDAVNCFERAAQCDSQLAVARSRLAEQWSNRGRPEQAEMLFRQSLGLEPEQVRGWFGLGRTLEDLGDAQGALGCYRQVLARCPSHVAAITQALGLSRDSAPAELLANAELLLADPALPAEAVALIGYGLAKYRDRNRHFAGAAAAGRVANNARRRASGALDRAALVARIDYLVKTCDAGFFAKRRRFGIGTSQPVFIVGLPRSGTTLTEQIMAAHPRLHGSGELPALQRMAARALTDEQPLWQSVAQLDEMGSRELASTYIKLLRDGAPKSSLRISDKTPLNLFQLGFAALLFPNARVIHCTRAARDNALSIWLENFAPTQHYATDFDDLAFLATQVERLMTHWQDVLPLPVLDMRYEDTVANVEQQAHRLMDFLDVSWDDRCLDFHRQSRAVQTPSRWQVRQPIYTGSVGRWRNYAEQLPELVAAFS